MKCGKGGPNTGDGCEGRDEGNGIGVMIVSMEVSRKSCDEMGWDMWGRKWDLG